MTKKQDEEFMREAIQLAGRGRGYVEPNPCVGAVIVRDGEVISKGYHRRFGGPHAEIVALRKLTSAVGATIHLTLEPCCHKGKTPPCTDAIISSGMKEVVVATIDPAKHASGKGIRQLKKAGIAVRVGLLEEEARRLNAPYFKLVETGIPYVIAKWAMTLDGKLAAKSGDSKWITGKKARRDAHKIRGRVDAIMVGINTVLADDPMLTARLAKARRVAWRVVMDTDCRTPLSAAVVRTASEIPTLVVCGDNADDRKARKLENAGCRVLRVETDGKGLPDIRKALEILGEEKVTNLLIEGGAAVLGSAFDAGVVDRVLCYIAPKIAGGSAAISPVAGAGVEHISEALQIEHYQVRRLGNDMLLDGTLKVDDCSGGAAKLPPH